MAARISPSVCQTLGYSCQITMDAIVGMATDRRSSDTTTATPLRLNITKSSRNIVWYWKPWTAPNASAGQVGTTPDCTSTIVAITHAVA